MLSWFQNLKTSRKIASLVAFMTVLTILVGSIGFTQLDIANADMKEMYEDSVVPASTLNKLQNAGREMERKLMEGARPGAELDMAKLSKELEAQRAELNALLEAVGGTTMDGKEQELLASIKNSLEQYASTMVPILQQRVFESAVEASGATAAAPAQASGSAAPPDDEMAGQFEKGQQLLSQAGEAIEELTAYNTEQAKEMTLDIRERAAKASRDMLMLIILAAALASLMGWWISRQIAVPIRRIAKAAERVAAGDLRVEPLAFGRKDELGELSVSVDRMVDSLKGLLHRLAESSELVGESSRALLDQAVRTESAGSAISESARHTDEAAREQSLRISVMSRTLQEMASAIRSTADSGEAAAAASYRSSEAAGSGMKVIGKAVEDMEAVYRATQAAAARMMELDREAGQISEIAMLISEIASHTNLLALNASIEAARAGEHGRGFGVVALEVRKLAEQAGVSSEQAAETVKRLRRGTQQAAARMQENAVKAESGVSAAREAGAMFRDITMEVNGVSSRMTDLSAAVEQAFAGAQEIVASAESLGSIAGRFAGESEQAARKAVETVSAMKEIRSFSERLDQESGHLARLMKTFSL